MSTALADPPKPKPATEAKPKPDPAAARRFAEGITGTKEKVKPAEDKPKEGDDKPAAAAAAPKAKAEKPKPATPAPALDRETIASAVAEGVERGTKKQETAEAKPEETTLPPAEAKRLAVLERMEKANPDKYKGRAKAYRESYDKLVKYAAEWEKDNPGKDFVEDDDEHKEFFEKNEVDWDDEDFTEALADMKADEKVGAAKKEIDQKFATVERAEKLRTEAPKIEQSKVASALTYFKAMDGDFAKVLKEDGREDSELVKKLAESDPVKAQIIISGAARVEELVGETYKLFTSLADYDANNANHRAINDFVLAKEDQLSKKPEKEQRDGKGRPFLPAAKYWKLDAAEREKHWTFGREDVDAMLTATMAATIKQQVEFEEEKFKRIAKARGLTIPEAKAAAAEEAVETAKPAESDDEPAEDDDKPSSPSAQAQPRIAEVKGAKPDASAKSRFRSSLIGE